MKLLLRTPVLLERTTVLFQSMGRGRDRAMTEHSWDTTTTATGMESFGLKSFFGSLITLSKLATPSTRKVLTNSLVYDPALSPTGRGWGPWSAAHSGRDSMPNILSLLQVGEWGCFRHSLIISMSSALHLPFQNLAPYLSL